jgi:plasmid stability protein
MHMAKRRTSILVDETTYELYEVRARRHGTTVSEEMRQVLDDAICDENPNKAFIELMEDMAKYDWKPGPSINSDEWKRELVDLIERDAFGREPAG